eukprot:TRINITY_DN11753_c0_g1_i2.p2 TRINITY_DN11753_c0_g1~~TRINITY_DN11753_c0_g1_i2.p2  ORF type:complete len:297 (+),score=50.31 TRINITY_DN11753_c0_g1_i2:2000-2890(+)
MQTAAADMSSSIDTLSELQANATAAQDQQFATILTSLSSLSTRVGAVEATTAQLAQDQASQKSTVAQLTTCGLGKQFRQNDGSCADAETMPALATDIDRSLANNNFRMFWSTANEKLALCVNRKLQLIASGVKRFADGFANQDSGPDLTSEGWTQCYGFLNNGKSAPTLSTIKGLCGNHDEVLFAGYRAGSSTLVRHEARLRRPLGEYLLQAPSTAAATPFHDFDLDNRYSWEYSSQWILLTWNRNGWRDPGRLWEPTIEPSITTQTAGHVLSQTGNERHDQHTVYGDAYLIYVKQ